MSAFHDSLRATQKKKLTGRQKEGKRAQWIGVAAARQAARISGCAKVTRNCEFIGFLPLELCPGLNAFAEMPPWQRQKLKREALGLLAAQYGSKRKKPLTGRPTVRLTRFSSVEPDAHSAWSKVPVDCLVASWTRGGKTHEGLGILEDDRPSKLELVTEWRPAKRGEGFVMIAVFEDMGMASGCASGGAVSSGGRELTAGGVSR